MRVTLSALQQRLVAIGLLAALLAFGFAYVGLPLWTEAALHNERVGMLRAQAVKLEALVSAAPRFEALSREVSSNPGVQALAYQGAPAEVSVAELQAALNRIFSEAGATMTRGQAVPLADGNKIAVEAAVEADIAALVRGLHGIGAARPLLKVERISVHEPDAEFALAKPVGPQPNVPNKLIIELVVSAHVRRVS